MISKTIKIKEDTYESLEELRAARDTFDEIIKRLLRLYANACIYRQTIDETTELAGRDK